MMSHIKLFIQTQLEIVKSVFIFMSLGSLMVVFPFILGLFFGGIFVDEDSPSYVPTSLAIVFGVVGFVLFCKTLSKLESKKEKKGENNKG